MPSFLTIKPDETVTVKLINDQPKRVNMEGDFGPYTLYQYSLEHNGQTLTYGASKAVRDKIEGSNAISGDLITIKRSGAGINTKWDVELVDRSAPQAPQNPIPAPPRGKLTYKEIEDTFFAIYKSVSGRIGSMPDMTTTPEDVRVISTSLFIHVMREGVKVSSQEKPAPSKPTASKILTAAGAKPDEFDALVRAASSGLLHYEEDDDELVTWLVSLGANELKEYYESQSWLPS